MKLKTLVVLSVHDDYIQTTSQKKLIQSDETIRNIDLIESQSVHGLTPIDL